MPAKLIAVQLETCHNDHDGSAWYAYYTAPTADFDVNELRAAAKKDGAPLGFESDAAELVPNALSEATRLCRYYVGFGS